MNLTELRQRERMKRRIAMCVLAVLTAVFSLAAIGNAAYAAGLVDETIDSSNLYSQYSLAHYQLDFYVDTAWDWLPWNWLAGIGKSVTYGIYVVTNVIWTLGMYLSNATGYLIQQAYQLDFITDTATEIGKNIQTIAGVSTSGISASGFYAKMLLIIIAVVGAYVVYSGVVKRESTKAIQAVVNLVVVFVLATSLIAFAPSLIVTVNEFSAEVSQGALSVGTQIMTGGESSNSDSVDLIRDNLFQIQVKQPWLLLQFGDTEVDEARANSILTADPNDSSTTREDAVAADIENYNNENLSIGGAGTRFAMVLFLFIFNIAISAFVLLLCAQMLLSQILFIVYVMFLPISFLVSMLPGFSSTSKKAILNLLNTILQRAGITLIITIAFSISTMFYSLSSNYPFFITAFLQILTFAGIYFGMPKIMGMMSLDGGSDANVGSRIMRAPRTFMRRNVSRLNRNLARSIKGGKSNASRTNSKGTSGNTETAEHSYGNANNSEESRESPSFGKRMAKRAAAVVDTPSRIADKASEVADTVKNAPTNAAYTVQRNVQDFSSGMSEQRSGMSEKRAQKKEKRAQTVAERRAAMEQKRTAKQENQEPTLNNPPTAWVRPPRQEAAKRAEQARSQEPQASQAKPHERPTAEQARSSEAHAAQESQRKAAHIKDRPTTQERQSEQSHESSKSNERETTRQSQNKPQQREAFPRIEDRPSTQQPQGAPHERPTVQQPQKREQEPQGARPQERSKTQEPQAKPQESRESHVEALQTAQAVQSRKVEQRQTQSRNADRTKQDLKEEKKQAKQEVKRNKKAERHGDTT